MHECGKDPESLGCEVCKPTMASIFASLFNQHVMDKPMHMLQETNDKFLANIQRNGTFSVVPRVPGGEITPEKLSVCPWVSIVLPLLIAMLRALEISTSVLKVP